MAKTKETPLKIGFWHAVRDIAVTSINKGQFPLALIGAMLLVALVKMPWQAIQDVLLRVVEKLAHWDLIGWLLWLLTATAWVFIGRRSRKAHVSEMRRVAQEKSDLHQKLLGPNATSSEQ